MSESQRTVGRPSIASLALISLTATWLAAASAPNRLPNRDEDLPAREEYTRLYLYYQDISEEEKTGRRWFSPATEESPDQAFFYRKAAAGFREHLEKHPDGETTDLARFQLGKCLWLLGEKGDAAAEWGRVAHSSDKWLAGRVRVGLAVHHFFEREYRKALENFEAGVTLAPDADDRLRCRLFAGICHVILREREEAKEDLRALLREIGGGRVDIPLDVIRTAATACLQHLPSKRRGAGEAIERYTQLYAAYKKSRGDVNRWVSCDWWWAYPKDGEVGEPRMLRDDLERIFAALADPHASLDGLVRIVSHDPLDPPLPEPRIPPDRLVLSALDCLAGGKVATDEETAGLRRQVRSDVLAELIRVDLEGWDGIRHPQIIGALQAILADGSNPFREEAVRELVQIGTPEALEPVVRHLRRKSDFLRRPILEALVEERVRIDDSIVVEIFLDKDADATSMLGDPRTRVAAARYIALIDSPRAVLTLMQGIEERVPPKEEGHHIEEYLRLSLTEGIRDALATMRSPEAVETLAKIARKGSLPILQRRIVIEALGRMGRAEAVDALIPLLDEGPIDISCLAADALGFSGSTGARDAILLHLRKKPESPRFAYRLLTALRRLGVDEKVEGPVLEYAASERPDTRAAVHALLRQTGGAAGRAQLIAAVDDAEPAVRWHAIRGVGQGPPSAVGISALIARLSVEQDPLLVHQILKYLHRMTGVYPGPAPEAWRKWWKGEKERFDPAAVRLGAPPVGPEAEKTVTYFSLHVTSKRVTFVIDVSGSMAEEIIPLDTWRSTRTRERWRGNRMEKKIEIAKKELIQVLETFEEDTQFNIIWFSDDYSALWGRLRRATRSAKTHAIRVVKGLSPLSATNIFDTLAHALEDRKVDAIYLLSDGLPNRGAITDTDEILGEIRSRNAKRRVKIHTIDLQGESLFLYRLAKQNGGEHVSAVKSP